MATVCYTVARCPLPRGLLKCARMWHIGMCEGGMTVGLARLAVADRQLEAD